MVIGICVRKLWPQQRLTLARLKLNVFMTVVSKPFGYTVHPLFKTIHRAMKMWSYIAAGLPQYTKLHLGTKLLGLIIKVV